MLLIQCWWKHKNLLQNICLPGLSQARLITDDKVPELLLNNSGME